MLKYYTFIFETFDEDCFSHKTAAKYAPKKHYLSLFNRKCTKLKTIFSKIIFTPRIWPLYFAFEDSFDDRCFQIIIKTLLNFHFVFFPRPHAEVFIWNIVTRIAFIFTFRDHQLSLYCHSFFNIHPKKSLFLQFISCGATWNHTFGTGHQNHNCTYRNLHHFSFCFIWVYHILP